MAVVHLSILSLVGSESAEQGSVFNIRPLFLQQPVAAHPRYERAVELYKRDLENIFKEYRLSRSNEDMLFWLMFQPKVHVAKKPVNDDEYNRQRAARQEQIDIILEKISRSGYASLTKDEKDFLFKSSTKS